MNFARILTELLCFKLYLQLMHVDKVEQLLLSTLIREFREQQTSETHSMAHMVVLTVLLTMKECLF